MGNVIPRGSTLQPRQPLAFALCVVSAVVVGVVQAPLPSPALLAFGLVLMVSVVVVADPVRVAWVAVVSIGVAVALGVVQSGAQRSEYWWRLPWLVAFCVTAVVLAGIEQRRKRLVAEAGRLLHEIVDATSQPIFAKRFAGAPADGGRMVLVNQAWLDAVGSSGEGVVGGLDVDLFPAEMLDTFRAAEGAVLASGDPLAVEQVVTGPDGRPRTYITSLFALRDAEGVPSGVGGIATDVSARKLAEERLTAVFEQSPVPTLRLLNGGEDRTLVLDANNAVQRLLGHDVAGRSSPELAALVHPGDVADTWALVDSVVEAARSEGRDLGSTTALGREIRLVDAAGRELWVVLSVSAVGRPDARGNQELIVQFDDITARKAAEAALTERALTDSVTGLPNRYALSDRLATAIHRLRRRSGMVCVLFCDLDHFKQVNDAFGHQIGDLLLSEVAARLSSVLRPEDTVGRQGGDEFVIVCEGFADPTDAALLAVRLQERLHAPWRYGDHQFQPTASIGIAHTTDPGTDPGDLLRRADVAMYRAKDSGRDRIETYDRSLDDELSSALEMQQRLRSALRHEGLVLHYQPVVRLGDGAMVGVEALVRMLDSDGGLLAPDRFLPHAEASGLIGDVGSWVADRALADLRAWHDTGMPIDVGINISPTQLGRPGLATALLETAARHRVDPAWVIVEVTETALVNESSVAMASLAQLHEAGVRIALDDFGTGYSSLSWLHQFPVDIVKIDKSFVQTVLSDHRRAVVVRALLDIADETGLGVVAEGVETEQQRAFLAELGCEAAQGWLFGRPVPPDDPSWAGRLRAGHSAGGRRPAG